MHTRKQQPVTTSDQMPVEDRITIDPDVCNGRPTLRGKRVTVQTVLEFLSAGETAAEILRQYPCLEPEDIQACLASAARLMENHYLVQRSA